MSNGTETHAFLHAHGLNEEPQDLLAALVEAIKTMKASYFAEPGQEGLTAGELEVLRASGLDSNPEWDVDPLVRSVATYASPQ